MIASAYNFYLDCFDTKGHGVIYNTNSGTVMAIHDRSIWDSVVDNVISDIRADCLEILKENKVVVSTHEDELSEIRRRYERGTKDSGVLYLTIMPTEACNFTCPYCFLWEKKPRTMTKEIYDDILSYISKAIAEKQNLNSLVINWFGGEPTLCSKQIIDFMPKVMHIAKEKGITVYSSITTNGYLLTRSIFEEMVNAGVTSFQVTVDGTRETHNAGRPHRTQPDSYDVIMKNLSAIHMLNCDFKMDIRCNFTRKTIASVYDFIELYSAQFGDDSRFNLYCRPVYEYSTKENAVASMSDDILPLEEGIIQQNIFAQKIADMQGRQTQRRMVDPLPQPTLFWCNAESQDHIIVGADGRLYICDTLTDDEHAVGFLKNGVVVRNNRVDCAYDIFNDPRTEKCVSCKLLPICMGGCLRNRMKGEAQCFWTSSGIEKALKKYYG